MALFDDIKAEVVKANTTLDNIGADVSDLKSNAGELNAAQEAQVLSDLKALNAKAEAIDAQHTPAPPVVPPPAPQV